MFITHTHEKQMNFSQFRVHVDNTSESEDEGSGYSNTFGNRKVAQTFQRLVKVLTFKHTFIQE